MRNLFHVFLLVFGLGLCIAEASVSEEEKLRQELDSIGSLLSSIEDTQLLSDLLDQQEHIQRQLEALMVPPLDEDTLFAQLVDRQMNGGGSGISGRLLPYIQLDYRSEMEETLEVVRDLGDKAEIFGRQGLNDVHKFNAIVRIRSHLPMLINWDNDFLGTLGDRIFEESLQILQNFVPDLLDKREKQVFARALSKLEVHVRGNPIEEEETGMNVPEILSRITSLIEMGGYSPLAFRLCAMKISENLSEKGGCYEGFAGRLFVVYLTFLRESFESYLYQY